jgi:hypothetical protein
MELKTLHKSAIAAALEKARHYRLLNDPENAESICHDILRIEPDHQGALITLILAMTDQFDGGSERTNEARSYLDRLKDHYDREYYAGLICERRAKTILAGKSPMAKYAAFDWFERAMKHFSEAEGKRSPDNDDAILRWNSCMRMIQRHRLEPHPDEDRPYGD